MLELSLIANGALILMLWLVTLRSRRKIVDEKCATFAGCLSAISSGLAFDDSARRFEAIGCGLASLYGGANRASEMQLYVSRASMLRLFRPAVLADIGEHTRLLALQTAGTDDEPGNEMLEYIADAQAGDREPREIWGDDGVAAANFVAERKALEIYRAQVTSVPIKLFRF